MSRWCLRERSKPTAPRVKVLDKKDFEAANVEIPLYIDGNLEEKLDDLKAFTYNLENGKY